ncbi:PilN domain-containing protein [Candidatus Gottesmanbacteria bacterium]|nr:PilN domain-containing protein [Candidatus Gottesmanbacteria bacterium]
MPADFVHIDLLDKNDISRSPYGRLAAWAITYGRYIMIGTEIIVLLAFISRFTLDRKLTDLKDEIAQKQAILTANASFENEVRTLQNQLAKIKTLLSDQTKPIDLLTGLTTMLPSGVSFASYEYGDNKLTIAASAQSTQALSQFLSNIQANKSLASVEIGDVSKDALRGIQFKFTAKLAGAKTK